MATAYLSKTFSGNGTSRQIFTVSTWFKRSNFTQGFLWSSGTYSSTSLVQAAITVDGFFRLQTFNSSGSSLSDLKTNRRLRDPSSFYHIVIAVDTTQSTESSRVKIYINGVQETSFATATYPSQNANYMYSESITPFLIGGRTSNTEYFDGSMTHFNFIDGTAYDADDFGESDSVSGIWKPKTSPSVTYGTNGFFLKFENSGAMGTDSSGNTNTFTVSGTLTQNVDTPSNNFSTLNPLVNYSNFSGGTLSNGNTTHSNSSGTSNKISTLGMTSGKFYAEAKYTGGGNYNGVGFCSEPFLSGAATLANSTHGASLTYTDVYNGGVAYGTYATPSTNDIIGIALDIDNGYAYFSNNGVWGNSGVPTSGSTGTGGFLISRTDANSTYFFASEQNATPGTRGADWNFGQGYFGTTQVASAGTAPSEGGIFEYDCPSGYQALCTKGINSF